MPTFPIMAYPIFTGLSVRFLSLSLSLSHSSNGPSFVNFVALSFFFPGDTCKYKSYQLEPEVYPTDEYYLITNGTLVLPNDNVAYDASQFCFENIIRKNDDLNSDYEEIILKAFVCFPEEPQPPEKMIAYPVRKKKTNAYTCI